MPESTPDAPTAEKTPPPQKRSWRIRLPWRIRDYFCRLPADRFPVIASMADTIVADSDERFEFGVELLLDGLTARLQADR